MTTDVEQGFVWLDEVQGCEQMREQSYGKGVYAGVDTILEALGGTWEIRQEPINGA